MKKQHYRGYQGRQKSSLIGILFAFILAGCLLFSALFTAVVTGAKDDIDAQPQVMLILGCQVMDWGPSYLLQDRLDTALAYLEEHPDMLVVVSGGQGSNEPMSEAKAMADFLVSHGISESTILLEEKSTSTWENLQFSAALLEACGVDTTDGILIVSNAFHLRRAGMLALRAGFAEVDVLAAPSSHIPSRIKMYIREPIALAKSFIVDR